MIEAVRSDMAPVIANDEALLARQIEQLRENVIRQRQEQKAGAKSPADARDYYSGSEGYSQAKNTYLSIREELRMRRTLSDRPLQDRDPEESGAGAGGGTEILSGTRPDGTAVRSFQVYNSLGHRQSMSFSSLAYIGTTVNARV